MYEYIYVFNELNVILIDDNEYNKYRGRGIAVDYTSVTDFDIQLIFRVISWDNRAGYA